MPAGIEDIYYVLYSAFVLNGSSSSGLLLSGKVLSLLISILSSKDLTADMIS